MSDSESKVFRMANKQARCDTLHEYALGSSTLRRERPYTRGMTDTVAKASYPAHVVARAVASRWSDDGQAQIEMVTDSLVYVHSHRLAEWVFDTSNDAVEAKTVLNTIRKAGIDVSIILPISELARAHEDLWGSGFNLHGWVSRDDGLIRFTGAEVA